MEGVERLSTGIPGLDKIIGGGFPRGTNILVCGGSGTGKTIFCTQFLIAGMEQYSEPAIFITLEERTADLRDEMLSLGWNLAEYEKNGKLIIIDATTSPLSVGKEFSIGGDFDIDSLVIEIHKASSRIGAKRLVVDSLPAMQLALESPLEFRRGLFRLSSLLLEVGLTSLMTTESVEPYLVSRYGVEEFVTRGVIILSLIEEGSDFKRFLRVRKMRGTTHSLRNIPFEILKGQGIVLYIAK
jgi:KaiC/GvpD/RAD55 family RecA-like ATPase